MRGGWGGTKSQKNVFFDTFPLSSSDTKVIDDKLYALLYDIGTCPATVSSKAVLLLHTSLKAQMVKPFLSSC